jgi:hypothetical protein
MIPIDTQQPKQKGNTTVKATTAVKLKKSEKRKKQDEIKEEYRKSFSSSSESEGEESSTEEEENNNNNNSIYITIWDLPKEINQLEVQHDCKKLGKLEEIQIKRSFSKALAVVKLQKKLSKTVSWIIPIGDEKLARVTEGIEDYKKRDSQSNVIAKLRGIPRGASEVLLLNNLRNRGAKSVYIPRNSNGRQRAVAIIAFEYEEDQEQATAKSVRYNNWILEWEDPYTRRKDSTTNKEEQY